MFYLVVWILVVEVLAIIAFIIMVFIENFYLTCKHKRQKEGGKVFSELIMECLQKKKLPTELFQNKFKDPFSLITTLETFNLRFQGGHWLKVKEDIANNLLLPLARKRVTSRSWALRHYAARSFALYPLQEDAPLILALIKDPVFFVHSIAALAAVRLEYEEGIFFMLEKMSKEKNNYSIIFYKDLILQGSNAVFKYIEKIAKEEPEEKIYAICLDILASKVMPLEEALLLTAMKSQSAEVKAAALRVYAHNPQKGSEAVLFEALSSKEEESIKEAAIGITRYPSEKAIEALQKALNNESMPIRLQVAESLKKMGPKGVKALKEQKERGDDFLSEVVNYVLEFS